MTYSAHAMDDPLRPSDHTKSQATDPENLRVDDVPEQAMTLNIEGREVHTPLEGFGQLWHKIYQLRFDDQGPPPEVVMREWKAHFSEFWPPGSDMYTPLTGIQPGEVAVINLGVPGVVALSTGMYVADVNARSFTLLTAEGHILAGRITFSAFSDDDNHTFLQIDVLMRTGDPLYEVALILGGHRQEDRFWAYTLHRLAQHFNSRGRIRGRRACLDRRRQWRYAGNIWQNAVIRTALYNATAPPRWLWSRGVPARKET
jgi:hypothetical protein